ncbi:MAG TPA: HepT-like ribonuclease domain-containing protein [Anaerolineales bacterium]
MQLDEQARVNLWDMREAAREIAGFVHGVQFEEFEKNKVLRYAVERQLHLIGEVASHIPSGFRKKHPEVDWMRLSDLRRFIAHQYGDTVTKRVWLAATESLPAVLVLLEKLLSE